ncbi:AtpZ/AtpI family protein [Kaistia dalseonensis]|uniref:ATP synthase protein I n=1 Tax=Kaistia dalseonensis TaxID=410840 RepID=A0ABU0HCS1_9HYPH|nr:AtpZ/AtpI family protein [Kaistia dalseonensis]MCX5497482.1 AtpZ/AtpI family protein [Kaistia dalseonensis]MDQ0440121.1 ATP synthase protein I [Kaistia dalseonensis]
MSDMGSQGDGKKHGRLAEDEAALSERLRALGSRLDKAQADAKQQAQAGEPSSAGMQGMGLAVRVASEFASGVLVGAGLGWLVDKWLGTSPWGLIVLLLLGFVAGVLNVLRAVGKVAQPEARQKLRKTGRE